MNKNVFHYIYNLSELKPIHNYIFSIYFEIIIILYAVSANQNKVQKFKSIT